MKNLVDEKLDIKELTEAIKKDITENIDIYERAYEAEMEDKLDVVKIKAVLSLDYNCSYGNLEKFKNDVGIITVNKVPYGNIECIYDGEIDVTIAIILTAIASRNTVTLNCKKSLVTNMMVIERLNKVLEVFDISDKCYMKNMVVDKPNAYLSVGKIDRKNIELNIPIISSNFGKYIMYVHDNIDNELVKKCIDSGVECIAKEGVLDYNNIIVVKDEKEALEKINSKQRKYSVGIFTKDNNIATYMIEKLYTSNLFINASPMLTNMFDISCDDLLYTKKICLNK